ncbi:14371_t:CDS:2 [Dentiscutata heterogama]|uniref:14371_t:CDS:1 n=1 Tax=Dentiscutata heterogama TaxID=1316150 RepID=A0ACA9K1V0_9GLOM|nr:14371_t:CDS:2 [Dentiscutata heterogama]
MLRLEDTFFVSFITRVVYLGAFCYRSCPFMFLLFFLDIAFVIGVI